MDFFDRVFADPPNKGWVEFATGYPPNTRHWYRPEALGEVPIQQDRDTFFAPSLRKSKASTKEAVLASRTLWVDIDNDAVNDYIVSIQEPICERSLRADVQATSSVQLVGFTPGGVYNTVWAIRGTATDPLTGASVTVVQRVRVLLSKVDKEAVCA